MARKGWLEVKTRRPRLVLGWVTTREGHRNKMLTVNSEKQLTLYIHGEVGYGCVVLGNQSLSLLTVCRMQRCALVLEH